MSHSIPIYDLTFSVLVRGLKTLRHILQKAESTPNITAETLLTSQLAPDMKPLAFQVQRMSDAAKGIVSRLGNLDSAPSYEDNETTFAQLYERIDKTLAFLESIDKTKFEQEGKTVEDEVVVKFGTTEVKHNAQEHLMFCLPNFYFHLSIAYAILRHAGVPVGKADIVRLDS